jgi:hypothetical protein
MHRNTHINSRHVNTWMPHTHRPYHTKPHMLPHTPSPPSMAPYTLPPSRPHSLKRRELVKDSCRQHADPVVEQEEFPGHETRRQSAEHTPQAHARCDQFASLTQIQRERDRHTHTHTHTHTVRLLIIHTCANAVMYDSNVLSAFSPFHFTCT